MSASFDVLRILQQLEPAHLLALKSFAERHLYGRGLPRHCGEDIVQQAMLSLLIGSTSDVEGRHPRNADLLDISTFLTYLKGVIRSLIDAKRARGRRALNHVQWQDDLTSHALDEGPSLARPADESVAFLDLHEQLFLKLRAQAPARLQLLIARWQQLEPDTTRIPTAGRHRRLRAELRKLSKRALTELDAVNRRVAGTVLKASHIYE